MKGNGKVEVNRKNKGENLFGAIVRRTERSAAASVINKVRDLVAERRRRRAAPGRHHQNIGYQRKKP